MPANVPGQLLVDMFISAREEGMMKVQREVTDQYRDEHNLLNSDAIEVERQNLQREALEQAPQAKNRRRPRAPSSPPSSSRVQHPPVRP